MRWDLFFFSPTRLPPRALSSFQQKIKYLPAFTKFNSFVNCWKPYVQLEESYFLVSSLILSGIRTTRIAFPPFVFPLPWNILMTSKTKLGSRANTIPTRYPLTRDFYLASKYLHLFFCYVGQKQLKENCTLLVLTPQNLISGRHYYTILAKSVSFEIFMWRRIFKTTERHFKIAIYNLCILDYLRLAILNLVWNFCEIPWKR